MINKKKKEKKKDNKKRYKDNKKIIIGVVIAVIILLVVLLLVIFIGTKKIECSKKVGNDNFSMKSKIEIDLKYNKIKKINVKKEIKISDNEVDYLSVLKQSLQETYSDLDVIYDIKKQGDELLVNITYNKAKEYVLDNLDIDLQESGMSIDIISEDGEGNNAKIDLSKEYKDEKIIKILQKADYKCE